MPKARSKKSTAQLEQQILTLQSQINGRVLRIAEDPPAVTPRPWYPVTYSHAWSFAPGDPPSQKLTNADIANGLRRQLNLGAQPAAVHLQIKSVKVWAPAIWHALSVTVTWEGSTIHQGMDTSTRGNSPRYGYELPSSYSSRVVISKVESDVLIVKPSRQDSSATSSDGRDVIAQVHCLWRMADSATSLSERAAGISSAFELIDEVEALTLRP